MTACSRPPGVFSVLVFALAAAGLYFSAAPGLWAHDPFEMTANGKLFANRLELHVVMSRSTAYALVAPTLPAGTTFASDAFAGLTPALEAHGRDILEIKEADSPLELRKTTVVLTQEEDVEFFLEYTAPTKSPLHFRAAQVKKLGYGYGIALTLLRENNQFLGSKLLMEDDLTFDLPLAFASGDNRENTPAEPAAPAKPSFSFRNYVHLGIEHILTGYDHLLFLCALLVVCRSLRGFLIIITCFTLAHSLTLGLAALDIVSLSPRIVEPLIAASIVYVAVENLLRRGQEPKGRGWLTFTFGLIHGFGFAGALKATGLGRDMASLALPLFSFNLGVEIGQMLVAVICLPLWWQLRKIKSVERYGAIAVSCVVAVAGLYWLLERTVL